MIHIEIKNEPLKEIWALEHLKNPAHGGRAFFFGSVRNLNLGRKVLRVEYECFEPLAVTTLQTIIEEARAQWGDVDIYVSHAVGSIAVGELSVAIGVTSTHRREAFQACQYVIDELKERAPIWKKEFYEDGQSDWVQGHALCQRSHRSHPGGRQKLADGHQQSLTQNPKPTAH